MNSLDNSFKAPQINSVDHKGIIKDWTVLEEWLANRAFKDKYRKNGTPMAGHSIRVGQLVEKIGGDDISIFVGYCHDVIEDVPEVSRKELFDVAYSIFHDNSIADYAVSLVDECSYKEDEYKLPKKNRKKVACKRWSEAADLRICLVKLCDVGDNKLDAASVGIEFLDSYNSWALPLETKLKMVLLEAKVIQEEIQELTQEENNGFKM